MIKNEMKKGWKDSWIKQDLPRKIIQIFDRKLANSGGKDSGYLSLEEVCDFLQVRFPLSLVVPQALRSLTEDGLLKQRGTKRTAEWKRVTLKQKQAYRSLTVGKFVQQQRLSKTEVDRTVRHLRHVFGVALRAGQVTMGSCCQCGCSRATAIHVRPENPLDVRWLCPRCIEWQAKSLSMEAPDPFFLECLRYSVRVPNGDFVYARVPMRSQWEVTFARFCHIFGVPWEYEPCTFFLAENVWYTPDFYVETPFGPCFIEIHGRFYNAKEAKKYHRIQLAKKDISILFNGAPLLLLGGKEMRKMQKRIENLEYVVDRDWLGHPKKVPFDPDFSGELELDEILNIRDYRGEDYYRSVISRRRLVPSSGSGTPPSGTPSGSDVL